MSSSEKLTCKGDLAAGVYLSEAPNLIRTLLHTVHCTVYDTYSHREGRGELNQREGERGNSGEYRSQTWVENTNMTECT
jgi:hypothetical protein